MIELVIDLETIKSTNESNNNYITEKLKAPANYKSKEAIDKWIANNKDAAIEKTVFNPLYGSIITIGYTVNDSGINAYQCTEKLSEADILQAFFDTLKDVARDENTAPHLMQIRWICHNKEFDLRYLYMRCVINKINTYGIKIPINARHDSREVYCTMQAVMGFKAVAGGSLDAICKALGLEGKQGFCGADVWGAWESKEYQKIAEYCMDDARLTREIYNRLKNY